jgi:hypothetical protein
MKSLTIEEFGDELLRTGDLDPVYAALVKTPMDTATQASLLVAYWCFYHLGAAACIAEKSRKKPALFWELLAAAAANEIKPFTRPAGERWPRASERRHFRGQQAIDAVYGLSGKYKRPEQMLERLYVPGDGARPTFGGVAARAQEHRGFGPWMAFKIADMGERVLGHDIDFSDCTLGIYKDPRQGAALAHHELSFERGESQLSEFDQTPWKRPITDTELRDTVDHYVAHWRKKKAKAPPSRDRLVNVQEIETIFCKYKSHRKGHYTVGKDIVEVGHALDGWGDLASELRKHLPKPVA